MYEIPHHRLPPGFADTIDDPPARPAAARPAATIVLLRDADGDGRLEVLLMRRHGNSGFVPGAWVFPGGRVDTADSAPPLYQRIRGLPSDPAPEAAFWTAAIRELFEETGVLLGRTAAGDWVRDAATDGRLEASRRALMDDELTLMDVLDEHDVVLDAASMVHLAHWVTPVVEARRYDTHFFAAVLPEGRTARHDPREMTATLWLEPAAALERFQRGDLPMVFPTVKTLESLAGYPSAEDALDDVRTQDVRRILPRLVRTDAGVAIVVDD